MKHLRCMKSTPGFSLVEILIALAVFSILVCAILGFFSSQRKIYVMEDIRLERDQNVRMAIEALSNELSMSGFCSADRAFVERLSIWVPDKFIPTEPMAVVLDANPKITVGDDNMPDVITFASSIPTATNPTTLSLDSSETELTLSLSRSDVSRQFKKGDIVSVGYLPEYAKVTRIVGRTLTVDTDPESVGLQPLSGKYSTGAPVGEISVISYTVFNDENDPDFKRHEAGRPLLKRKVNAGGFYPVSENILRLKAVEPGAGLLQVSLTGLTEKEPLKTVGTGEMTLISEIALRNTTRTGFASDCSLPAAPSGLVIHKGLEEGFPCQIYLSWEQVTTDVPGKSLSELGCPVTGYRILYDVAAGVFGYHVGVSTEDASGYILDVSGVPSSEFYVSIAAENSGGFGNKSSEEVVSDEAPPERPAGVSAAVAGPNQIKLFWNENHECDLAGYLIYRRKDGGSLNLITGSLLTKGTVEYTDSGLESSAAYAYAIRAVDFGFNPSGFSEEVTIALP